MRKSAILGVVLLAGFFGLAEWGEAQELGKYLKAHGYTTTAWIDYANVHKVVYGHFDANVIGPNDFPSCYVRPIGPCIDAFNRRYGSAAGGGRLSAPWRRKGDLIGERYSRATLAAFFVKAGLTGEPTELDREDAVLVSGVWDGLIAPSGAGVLTPPPGGDGGSGDPCADWFAELTAWLAKVPSAPPGGDCTDLTGELDGWLTQIPQAPSPNCLAPR